MVFCNVGEKKIGASAVRVTILILIDGFLQSEATVAGAEMEASHNPYFNRWFSAIDVKSNDKYYSIRSQSLF